MSTTTPLTDSINALTTYANSVTGASDTTLSDAVYTLAQGYGQGGDSTLWKTVTLAEVHGTPSIGNPVYWDEYLGITEQDDLADYIYVAVFVDNQWNDAYRTCMLCYTTQEGLKFVGIRQASIINNYSTEYYCYATQGTVINIYKLPRIA